MKARGSTFSRSTNCDRPETLYVLYADLLSCVWYAVDNEALQFADVRCRTVLSDVSADI